MLPTDDPSVAFDGIVYWLTAGEIGPASAVSELGASGGAFQYFFDVPIAGINLPAWDARNPAVVSAWRNASREVAASASGNVRVLQADAVRINSVWAQVEFPALKANPNVTSITSIDPRTGAEVLLWSR